MDSRGFNEKDITSSLDGIAASIRDGGLTPSVIADVYDNTKTYAVGDYVVYEGKSYRCITAVETAEEFDSEKWDQIKVLDELSSAVELPPVTSSDNGKILGVEEGEWTKIDPPSGGDEIVYFIQDALGSTAFYKNTIPSLTGATEITNYSDISDLFDITNGKVKDGTKIYFVFIAEPDSETSYWFTDPALLHVNSISAGSMISTYGGTTYVKKNSSDSGIYYIKALVNFKKTAVQATVKRYTITATEIV